MAFCGVLPPADTRIARKLDGKCRGLIMKYLKIILVIVCLLFSLMPAMADQAEDEAAIRKVIEAIISTSNNGDAKAMMAYCDPVYETPDGSFKDNEVITEGYAKLFEQAKDFHVEQLEEIGIVFVTPDIAIYKDRRQLTGYIDGEGNPSPPLTRLTAWVMVKRNDNWLCAAYFYRPIED
jgi:ketosteroid isomerase-like protein